MILAHIPTNSPPERYAGVLENIEVFFIHSYVFRNNTKMLSCKLGSSHFFDILLYWLKIISVYLSIHIPFYIGTYL